jgi:deoxyribodipyrimidine photo-lyase
MAGPPLPEVLKQPDPAFQPGGETPARRYLQGFLEERSENYARHLSKPQLSRRSCSRLSPYLAYGNLSPREVWQWAERYKRRPGLARPLAFFQDRLWWRSHYMQKLESEWQIEERAINPALNEIDRGYDEALFRAWAEGRTGFPIVDAAMRCLHANGWLNFRLRATLATFVTFTLWQDWKAAAVHLARLFLDFEPGIHYGQFQMQAGLSGYHPLRIFNPLLQTEQHDPDGAFIHRYVPELRTVPAPLLAAPWTMTRLEQQLYHCRIGIDYPAPIVDYEAATRRARDRYWAFRQQPAVREYLPKLWQRHCLPQNIEKYLRELK